jgi:acetyltransferase-like isoleucine patch superfamily enzyme
MIKCIIRFGTKFRRAISRRITQFIVSAQLNKVGKGFVCDEKVLVYGGENIQLGENVILNRGVILQSCEGAKIEMGNNITLSYNVKVLTGNLSIKSLDSSNIRGHNSDSIKFGNNIWIGANTIILPGVEIADNIIIGAGSIINKSIEGANCLYAGNPGRRIKSLNE